MDNATVISKLVGVSHRNIARFTTGDYWLCPNCADINKTEEVFIQLGDEIVCDYCCKTYIVGE